METTKLRRFAQYARRTLMELVAARLQLVLQAGSAARRENLEAIKKLEEAIKSHGEAAVIERVAYTWFNRFCALRFMDVNRYTRIGVVSPAEGQFQPEILAEAKMGHIDVETVPEKIRQQIAALLAGSAPSHDPQGEAYRLLVVAACNAFHRAMPFLFERIDDYTELLMPDDLLSGNSILAYTREAMTPDACKDVEVIGWLYQFYISEKKDAVFEGLKKNQKITPENIPAATQLFTPHWIVRYLLENSLGRLWLLNRPDSKLAERMDYYIRSEEPETDFLKISKPEEIKICDPACGSGHMLTYAFDLLYAIYEEDGVDPAEIPEKILTHNLYGIEIDERAGELAAFALTMKARAKQRRFFSRGVKPNICVLESVKFDEDELKEYMSFVGRDLFTAPLQTTLHQFEEADNFGSLIRPQITDVDGMRKLLDSKDLSGYLFLSQTHEKVRQALRQADYLSPQYHVVVANPPYMGSGNMSLRLKAWMSTCYPASKTDLMTAFMERIPDLLVDGGFWGMINLPAWMFLGAYERLRLILLTTQRFHSLLHLGRGIFGADFGSVAFILDNRKSRKLEKSNFFKLFTNHVEVRTSAEIEKIFLSRNSKYYVLEQDELIKIPGQPIAYWANADVRRAFEESRTLSDHAEIKTGIIAGDNEAFIRGWYEVSNKRISPKGKVSIDFTKKWYPLLKGGERRKWYGNLENIIDYEGEGGNLSATPNAMLRNKNYYFREGIHWNRLSNEYFGARLTEQGCIFEDLSPSLFSNDAQSKILPYLNSCVAQYFLKLFTSGRKTEIGHVGNLPYPTTYILDQTTENGRQAVGISQFDWNSRETSWDFTGLPLLSSDFHEPNLKATYQQLRAQWRGMTLDMQRLEEQNNRIFIDAYGLQDELTHEVPLNEITLTCNPHYRYGGGKSEDELETMLLADTMRELVSYAVGCIFGRYSLDKSGLILASQGEGIVDYLRQIPNPSFMADDDNVIPMLGGDWFTDDITARFRTFLRVAFGESNYEENLQFIEKGLGKNGKARDINDYLLKDFYADHLKRYKKRPIYWLFSSPKGTFSALIYLHRYRLDTVSVVLNGYLRDFRNKLATHLSYLQQVGISITANQAQKTRANKEIDDIKQKLQELDDYERDVLYPLATEQVSLDLDDGVKVNYLKLGLALKKIVGLDTKEED